MQSIRWKKKQPALLSAFAKGGAEIGTKGGAETGTKAKFKENVDKSLSSYVYFVTDMLKQRIIISLAVSQSQILKTRSEIYT